MVWLIQKKSTQIGGTCLDLSTFRRLNFNQILSQYTPFIVVTRLSIKLLNQKIICIGLIEQKYID